MDAAPAARIAVVVPTLARDGSWKQCLEALARQRFGDFEVIVVDNSGQGCVQGVTDAGVRVRVIANERNVGFGGAINQGICGSEAELVAVLNDDAIPAPTWLDALARAAGEHPGAGMFASCVRLGGRDELDSAGMLIAADGSSRQRGHKQPATHFRDEREVLLPSGSAALYRRSALEDAGLFDESYFLYCEDTDLGLRMRWAGWECRYVPEAEVEHAYSLSAGRASPLKAYLVERNRLFTVIKNFPLAMLAGVPLASAVRYFWHAADALGGTGSASQFRREGHGVVRLVWYVVKAHGAAMARLPRLLAARKAVKRRIPESDFRGLLRRHSISLREVGSL